MPKCKIRKCNNFTRYSNTTETYCSMHRARIKRNGNAELKKGAHALEKLPHKNIDDFILKNCHKMLDKDIAIYLKKQGFKEANQWIVRYRRRKLGIKKYSYGETKKHKVWIRNQAIKKYGNNCELCDYSLSIDTHHIEPKKNGGLHEIENLMILCPNCHALITRNILNLSNRQEIPKTKRNLLKLIRASQPNLG